MTPVDVASLDRLRTQAPAPVGEYATVENHIPALVREYMLEIQILFGLGARHDEEQVCHDRLPRIPAADCEFTQGRTPGRSQACGAVRWETELSEDSATRETEGGRAEPWATCRLARMTLVDRVNTGPHTHIGQQACSPDKREFPEFSPR